MNENELKQRTKNFGLRVIRLVEALPGKPTTRVIGHQLLRSAVSVGANYRAACQGRSKAEFASKLNIVLEETDESLYWMELLVDSEIMTQEKMTNLMQEATELVKIFTSSLTTVK